MTAATHPSDPLVRFASSHAESPREAVAEIARSLGDDCRSILFFCSSRFERGMLAAEIHARFRCEVAGCTTAGEILSPHGYADHSIVAAGFPSEALTFEAIPIGSLSRFLEQPANYIPARREPPIGVRQFAFALLDGMSTLEERVAAALHTALRGIPLVGGSAGDDLCFAETFVFCGGEFRSGAGVVALFSTTLDVLPLRVQHIGPTETKLVITEADAARRLVFEINGKPAAEEYCRIVGASPGNLSLGTLAANPVVLRVGDEYFVRSIQKANPDGSLSFYCAVERGLVLRLGKPRPILESLAEELAKARALMPDISLLLGCDCVLRRIEIERQVALPQADKVLAPYPFIGFSSYGEIAGALHVNQTLTAIAVGKMAAN